MEPEDILAHYGVPGMKWGRRKSEASSAEPSARQVKREEYKKNLKSANAKVDPYKKTWDPQSLTDDEIKALNKSGRRQVAGTLALTAGGVAAKLLISKVVNDAADKHMAESATKGAQWASRNMGALTNYPTIALRQGANGSWG